MIKTLLLILDGFGYRTERNYNSILEANTVFFKETYLKSVPIKASGEYVGLLPNQLSGSEIGHMTLGAGKIVDYIGSKWGRFIVSDEFLNSEVYQNLLDFNNKNQGNLHLIGLLSNGGIHSDISHLQALIDRFSINNDFKNIYLHIITDGRDTPSKYCLKLIKNLDLKNVKIASISGRYFAMDRDNNWDRIKLYYDTIVGDKNVLNIDNNDDKIFFENYINEQYNKGITDEFIEPVLKNYFMAIKDNDSILFFNFRSDRMRQIVKCFFYDENFLFNFFERKKFENIYICTASKYFPELPDDIVFIKQNPVLDVLSEKVSKLGYKQLKLAETEKYVHVTKFFNGERFDKFENEDWYMVSSPKVSTYDQKPQMSVYEITNYLLSEYKKYDFIVCNFANGDMVGHTGNFEAAKEAVYHMDICIRKILDELLKNKYMIIITSDHGNCEIMEGDFATTHTFSDVPLWIFKNNIDMNFTYEIVKKYNIISIADIANFIIDYK